MKRILVYGLSGQWGGIESIIHAIISQLEEEIVFDILISDSTVNDRHKRHGANVSIIPITAWGASIRKFRKELKKVYSDKHYDYVWINASLMCNRDIISVTKKYSNAEIITHSHGTYFEESNKLKERILLFLHRLNRPYFNRNVKYKLMCSEASGKWFYGEKAFNDGELHLIRNGIDTSTFQFNNIIRDSVRTNLGLSDKKIILHAGRLTEVKNQKFLIHLMRRMVDMKYDVKLLIIGDGELREDLDNLISSLDLKDSVMLLGARADIDQFYQAADVFVLPSFHEGFPVTLTEAQSAGLTCIVSNNISRETNITGSVKFLPVDDDSISEWTEAIEGISCSSEERKERGQIVINNRFDISDVAKDFKSLLETTTEIKK